MLIARRSDKGVTLWKNFRVSGFLFSNTALTDIGSHFDYGDYSHCAFQSGKFFPLWALARYRNLRSTNSRVVGVGM